MSLSRVQFNAWVTVACFFVPSVASADDLGIEGMRCFNHSPMDWTNCSDEMARLSKGDDPCIFTPLSFMVETSDYGLFFISFPEKDIKQESISTFWAFEGKASKTPCRLVERTFTDSGQLEVRIRDYQMTLLSTDGKVLTGVEMFRSNKRVILFSKYGRQSKPIHISTDDIDEMKSQNDDLIWRYRFSADGRILQAVRFANYGTTKFREHAFFPKYKDDTGMIAAIVANPNRPNTETDRMRVERLSDKEMREVYSRRSKGEFLPVFSRVLRKASGKTLVIEEAYHARKAKPGVKKLYQYDDDGKLIELAIYGAGEDKPTRKIEIEYKSNEHGEWNERRLFAVTPDEPKRLLKIQKREINRS